MYHFVQAGMSIPALQRGKECETQRQSNETKAALLSSCVCVVLGPGLLSPEAQPR